MTDKKRTETSENGIICYPSGIYYFRQGPKEISLHTKDFEIAVKEKHRIMALKGGIGAITRMKIKSLILEYEKSRVRDFKHGHIRSATLLHAQKNIRIISKHFGSISISKMESPVWEDLRHKIKGNQVVNVRSVFSHFMKWCAKRGYRTSVPIFDIGQIKRRKRRILKPAEIKAIWAFATGSLKLFIVHAMVLGMRRTEIMTLEWSQINFDERSIFLPEAKTKTKKDRWITLSPAVIALLKERKAQHRASKIRSKWVFPHINDGRKHADKSGLKTAWHTCLMRAFNVPKGEPRPNITWHDLRATCEFYAHKRTDLTATQLEKFFGASVDVQRRIYVQGDVEFVRGVEDSLLMPESTKEISVVGNDGENENE